MSFSGSSHCNRGLVIGPSCWKQHIDIMHLLLGHIPDVLVQGVANVNHIHYLAQDLSEQPDNEAKDNPINQSYEQAGARVQSTEPIHNAKYLKTGTKRQEEEHQQAGCQIPQKAAGKRETLRNEGA